MNRFPFRPGTALALGVLLLLAILGTVLLQNLAGDGVVIGGDDAGSIGDVDGLPIGDPGAGILTFEERCASCHGPEGEGSVVGPALLGEWLGESAFSDDEMAEVIWNGTGVMAGLRSLEPQDVADIVAYIRQLQR